MIFSLLVFIWVFIYLVVVQHVYSDTDNYNHNHSLMGNVNLDALVTYTVVLFDIYIKFLCVMLSFSVNKKYYYIFCGCFDSRCRFCIFRMVKRSYYGVPSRSEIVASSQDDDDEDDAKEMDL